MVHAQSSCGQLCTIAGLARQNSLPQLALENLPKVDKTLQTWLNAADARFKMDRIGTAQQPSWVAEVGSKSYVRNLGSRTGLTAPLWER